jgi:hypothetical protein
MSYVGMCIMVAGAVLTLFAMLSEATIQQPSAYVSLFTYAVFPALLFSGLVMVLWGMRREAVRRRRTGQLEALPYPSIDLNQPRQRRRFGFVVAGGGLLVTLLALVTHGGYLYTGSNSFCGTVCHTAMEPQFTAYQHSAHARVPCVDCHVGPGADSFVRSKVSGLRQVAAVMVGSYDKPIRASADDLRPARDTCEKCHWPKQYHDAKLVQLPVFRYDERNTAEQLSLLMKTGGGESKQGRSTGIHWHMAIDNVVTYAATDARRQSIPWVAVRRPDGTIVEYVDETAEPPAEELAALPRRTMDCMDCHNRPAHGFPSPQDSVDVELAAGHIPADLPWIKTAVVGALTARDHQSNDAARIRSAVRQFYETNHPAVAKQRAEEIDRAAGTAVAIYERTVFPESKVDWNTYPDNIGHRYSPGCFRCHDDRHVSKDGNRLSRSCSLCHTAPERGPVADIADQDYYGDVDWHPWDMSTEHVAIEAHDDVLCHECHQSGLRPKQQCVECHE